MNKLLIASAFATVFLVGIGVRADEVPTSSITVTLEWTRPGAGSSFGNKVWTNEAAIEAINWRLSHGKGDGDGWSGLGKLPHKVNCVPPLTLKAVATSGLPTWGRTNTSNPEVYSGRITKVRCE